MVFIGFPQVLQYRAMNLISSLLEPCPVMHAEAQEQQMKNARKRERALLVRLARLEAHLSLPQVTAATL